MTDYTLSMSTKYFSGTTQQFTEDFVTAFGIDSSESTKHGFYKGQQVFLDENIVTIISIRKHSLMIVDNHNMSYLVDFSAVQPINY
mgnify:CR=1 FL=1